MKLDINKIYAGKTDFNRKKLILFRKNVAVKDLLVRNQNANDFS